MTRPRCVGVAVGAVMVLLAVHHAEATKTTPAFIASHESGGYEGDCDPEWGDCGYRQDYDQWNNEDRNRNRNRNRGAFSPGPFDDSPVDAFNGNVVCLPGSTCYSDDRRGEEPPPEDQR